MVSRRKISSNGFINDYFSIDVDDEYMFSTYRYNDPDSEYGDEAPSFIHFNFYAMMHMQIDQNLHYNLTSRHHYNNVKLLKY